MLKKRKIIIDVRGGVLLFLVMLYFDNILGDDIIDKDGWC